MYVLLIVVLFLVLAGLSFVLVRAFMSPMVVIRPSVARSLSSYLGCGTNDAGALYQRIELEASRRVVIPFSTVVADRLEAMAIFHFAEPRGIRYLAFEPQIYRVPGGFELERVLAFAEQRENADVYIPRGKLSWENSTYRVERPVDEVRDTLEVDFDRFQLSVKDTGLFLDVAFTDRYGRYVELHVDEQRLGKQARFKSMIAPASLLSHADYFPLIVLSRMSIAHRRSLVSVKIDGKDMSLVKVPVLGQDLIIYSLTPVAYYLFLTAEDEPVQVHTLTPEQYVVNQRRPSCQPGREALIGEGDEVVMSFQLKDNNGFAEISSASFAYGQDAVRLDFVPCIPSLLYLRDGASSVGRFALSTDFVQAMMIGSYSVARAGSLVTLSLQLERAYQPLSGDLWVGAYRWMALLRLEESGPRLEAHWEKKQIINEGLHIKVV